MGNILTRHWQYATVVIETEEGGVGTGVLVGTIDPVAMNANGWPEDPWDKKAKRIYLVTARHVLGESASVIEQTIRYEIKYNAKVDGMLKSCSGEFDIANNPANWRVHPDPRVDVAALDITSFILERPEMYFAACPITEIANPISMLRKDVDIADEVIILGYPAGLVQGETVLPVARKGILATSPRRPLVTDGTKENAFLIDGAIIKGSSGSPVICSSDFFRAADLEMTPHRAILLGIVTNELCRKESRIIRVDAAHLGVAQHASAIAETIIAFGEVTAHDMLSLDHDAYWSPELEIEAGSLDPYGTAVDAATASKLMGEVRRKRLNKFGVRFGLSEHIANGEFGLANY